MKEAEPGCIMGGNCIPGIPAKGCYVGLAPAAAPGYYPYCYAIIY